jgi:hypothetical protein
MAVIVYALDEFAFLTNQLWMIEIASLYASDSFPVLSLSIWGILLFFGAIFSFKLGLINTRISDGIVDGIISGSYFYVILTLLEFDKGYIMPFSIVMSVILGIVSTCWVMYHIQGEREREERNLQKEREEMRLHIEFEEMCKKIKGL